MTRESDKPANVPWREQFPFAHAYVQESVFGNSERDPDFPRNWDHSESKEDVERSSLAFSGFSVVSALVSSHTPLEIRTKRFKLDHGAPIFYWEVDIDAAWGTLEGGMGFYAGHHKSYASGSRLLVNKGYPAAIQTRMSRSPDSSPTGVCKVIGCGITYGGGVFLTRNGHQIDRYPVSAGLSWEGFGYLRLNGGSGGYALLEANLGQRPFVFDIAGYCNSSFRRLRHLCNTLPRELLDIILTFMLLDIQSRNEGSDRSGFNINRDISRISLVCRRWRTVAERQVIEKLELWASTDVRRALALPLLWNCSRLRTDEDTPWIHTFLASTLPHRLTSIINWHCNARRSFVFGQGLPASMSHAIPALLHRGCFTNITHLTLSDLRFQSWLQFARFVLSFQQLDELSLAEVTWNGDEAPPCPPHWIRVARRIRRVWVKSYAHPKGTIQRSNCQSGLLYLFFMGRGVTSPPTSNNSLAPVLPHEETSAVAGIAHHVCHMAYFDYFEYEQLSPTHCTVSASEPDNPYGWGWALVLTFMQHPQKSTSQLVRISVRIGSDREELLQDSLFKPLAGLLSTLSNCDCNFNFSNLGGEYKLLSRVYMHEAVGDGLRVDAMTYDDYKAWRWEDGDSFWSIVRFQRVAVYKRKGDIVTAVWDIPRQLRECNPQFTQSVAFYGSIHDPRRLSEVDLEPKSPMQYITAIDIGMVDVVLPPQTGEQIYFQVIITYNGHCHRSSRHAYASSD